MFAAIYRAHNKYTIWQTTQKNFYSTRHTTNLSLFHQHVIDERSSRPIVLAARIVIIALSKCEKQKRRYKNRRKISEYLNENEVYYYANINSLINANQPKI